MSELVSLEEKVARCLAELDGYDPDESWEDFDRSAGLYVDQVGKYPGWEKEVFPKKVRWEEYMYKANRIVQLIKEDNDA